MAKVYEWMRARSEASKKSWQARWERGEAIGKKGIEYLEKQEREQSRTGGGGYGKRGGEWKRKPEDYEDIEAPVYDDEWEIDY